MSGAEFLPLVGAGTALLTAGAAWGSARKALNGTRERVQRIEQVLDDHVTRTARTNEEVARIGAKLDILIVKGTINEKV